MARRAGLIAAGAAPFVFFLLLLPPETPQSDKTPVSNPASTVPGERVPLEFPFLAAPESPDSSPTPEDETPTTGLSPLTTRPTARPTLSPPPTTTTAAGGAPAAPAPVSRFGAPAPGCSNGIDDDGDGSSDLADPGCSSGEDHAEADNPQCSDGLDDDGDGTVDSGDPGCSSPRDGDESDDNIIPTDNPTNLPGQPGGSGAGSSDEDPAGLDGLPS